MGGPTSQVSTSLLPGQPSSLGVKPEKPPDTSDALASSTTVHFPSPPHPVSRGQPNPVPPSTPDGRLGSQQGQGPPRGQTRPAPPFAYPGLQPYAYPGAHPPFPYSPFPHQVQLTNHELDRIAKSIQRLDPPEGGFEHTPLYLSDIESSLSDFPQATTAQKLYLIHKTSSPRVRQFLLTQQQALGEDFEMIKKALINNFAIPNYQGSLSLAISTKQKPGESVAVFFNRLFSAYYGTNRERKTGDEDYKFKELMVRNLYPRIREQLRPRIKLETMGITEIRQLAVEVQLEILGDEPKPPSKSALIVEELEGAYDRESSSSRQSRYNDRSNQRPSSLCSWWSDPAFRKS